MTLFIIVMASAYLIGSIPIGVVVSKLMGLQDPQTAGSGNIGATNVLRLGGKAAGLLTLLGDFGKGLIAVDLAGLWFSHGPTVWACGAAAILGHVFSVFLGFRGGKGVATGLGVVTPLWPWAAAALITIWLLTAVIFRYSSLAAIVAFFFLPVILWFVSRDPRAVAFGGAIASLILIRHRENIARLIAGTETKIGKSSRKL